MDNREVAEILEEMATLMELNGEGGFRIRAYVNAARAIDSLGDPVAALAAEGKLDSVRGIGKGLAGRISELVETGHLPGLDELKASIPEGLMEMTEIPGLGAKRIRAIYEELGIVDIDALSRACDSGDLEAMSGFGRKTAERIAHGIQYMQKHRGQFLCNSAGRDAAGIRVFLEDQANVDRVATAGSIRRRSETHSALDLVTCTRDPDGLAGAIIGHGEVDEVVEAGETRVSVTLKSGMRANLWLVEEEAFPAALHHVTGNEAHVAQMRDSASEMGLRLNEYGLFDGERRIPCGDEAALFESLGLSEIPPELREGGDEVRLAGAGELPALVSRADLRGTLHVHTRHSDGRADVMEMAKAAADLGYEYIGICDHSKAAAYANGLTEDRVRAQWEEIDSVNAELEDIRVLKGIEVDILGDGRLDFEDEFLSEFEVVVASVHSRFGMTESEATDRIVRAVRNPNVHILGHPTGRLLLSREGYPLDHRAVIEAAAEANTAIELNANPRRLDMDWRHIGYAREKGVKISINTDAHSIEGLEQMDYGLGVGRKGGLTTADVLNAMTLDDFQAWCAETK
ncbi:MAG: DNA polymerase/3'-5' exonuclease PolX [Gemmatimonadetes bacterium]|nr:DNA polymerase/3'-5' exonuclease PolX [Gemmatimonadota bacterium]